MIQKASKTVNLNHNFASFICDMCLKCDKLLTFALFKVVSQSELSKFLVNVSTLLLACHIRGRRSYDVNFPIFCPENAHDVVFRAVLLQQRRVWKYMGV